MDQDDLLTLQPPTSENLLRVLHRRFKRDTIHTRLGPRHLLTLNPYKILKKSPVGELSLEELLDEMCRKLSEGLETKQLLFTLGETGSGKTTSFSQAISHISSNSSKNIQFKLLAGVKLLQILGNCRTKANEDATRFVLMVETTLDFSASLTSYSLQTYLLDKSVVTCPNSPNFHAFYALLAGADPQLLKSLRLSRSAESYGILEPMPNNAHNGKEAFDTMRSSLSTLGLDEKPFFQILSAILKLGNIFFIPISQIDETGGVQLEPKSEFEDAVHLLGVNSAEFESALLLESIGTPRDSSSASNLRDNFLQSLYTRLFTFISKQLSSQNTNHLSSSTLHLIDYPGFSSSDKKGVGALTLNLISEKIAEVLLDIQLKEKQEEWMREGVKWVKIDTRPQPIGSFFDLNGPMGESLSSILAKSPFVSKEHSKKSSVFRIKHYAGTVSYNLEKLQVEKDSKISAALSLCCHRGTNPWLIFLFPEGSPAHTSGRILSQFSLLSLFVNNLASVSKNSSIYAVHCIKPNECNLASLFEGALVLHQLKYHRILDILAVKREGFDVGMSFSKFIGRYKLLSLKTWPIWSGGEKEGVGWILSDLLTVRQEEVFIGRTKVLLKTNLVNELEGYRRERLEDLALIIQKIWRGYRERSRWRRLKSAQKIISKNWKIWCQVRWTEAEVEEERRRVAIGKIQRAYLHWKRKSFLTQVHMMHSSWMSPLCTSWPQCPLFLERASEDLQAVFHRWRCRIFRISYFDPVSKSRMAEKVTASSLFRGKKSSYPRSLTHPFLGDYVRLRVNSEWRRVAKGESGLLFADMAHRISRTRGRLTPYLLAVSKVCILVLDPRTLAPKDRVPIGEVVKMSLSPYGDNIVAFHRMKLEPIESEGREACSGCSVFEERGSTKGDLLVSTDHVIELVTKVYLLAKASHPTKGPIVQVSDRFELNLGKNNMSVQFIVSGKDDGGSVRVGIKQGELRIVL